MALTKAQESQKYAELKAEEEVEARVEAQKLRELADQRAKEAIASSKQATALLGSSFITGSEGYASEVNIKVLKGMLATLPSNDSATTNNTILAAGHQLLGFPFSYTQQV